MPTGYTCFIENGQCQTAEQFAMICARAFGAMIEFRDEPISLFTEMPVLKVDGYHERALARAQEDLVKFNATTEEEWRAKMAIFAAADKEYYEKRLVEYAQKRDLYTNILAEVEAWQPPTKNHIELKSFMIDQIRISNNDSPPTPPKARKLREYITDERKSILWNLEYHAKEFAKEIERNAERNAWIQALWDSFKPAEEKA